jgi:hypothetical protein
VFVNAKVGVNKERKHVMKVQLKEGECAMHETDRTRCFLLFLAACATFAQERHVGAAKMNVYKSRLCVQMVWSGYVLKQSRT